MLSFHFLVSSFAGRRLWNPSYNGTSWSKTTDIHGVQNEWVQSVAAFSASYSDAGILGAYGAVNLEDAARFRDAVTAELESIASSGVSAEETARAAAKAKMAVATSCDSNAGLVQVSATVRAGKRNCEIESMDCRFAHLRVLLFRAQLAMY